MDTPWDDVVVAAEVMLVELEVVDDVVLTGPSVSAITIGEFAQHLVLLGPQHHLVVLAPFPSHGVTSVSPPKNFVVLLASVPTKLLA